MWVTTISTFTTGKYTMHTVEANGASVPAIGFGTWTLKGEQARSLVEHALEVGYRHVDTAAMYDNEEAVGKGLKSSSVVRDDIFLTTKVWHSDLAAGDLQRSVESSLKRLGVDAVNLVLVHWPSKTIPLEETIVALNDVAARGLAQHIGVSNFTVPLLTQAVEISERSLVCNQVEYHPMLNQDLVLNACRSQGMALVSYCPLFRGGELFANDPVSSMAGKYNKTPAQVVLRWQVQQDSVIAIPRSTNAARIADNLDVFDFVLADEDMNALSDLASNNKRLCDFEFSPQWDTA